MMNQDIKKEWVARLRQPERRQGTGCLRTEDGKQCCLDILNEMGVEAGIQSAPILEFNGSTNERVWYYPEETSVSHNGSLLTQAVINWAGLKDPDPFIREDDIEGHSLSSWNDAKHATFIEIADLIENDTDL
jgi:hypothetical protein